MFNETIDALSQKQRHDLFLENLEGYLDKTLKPVTNLANMSAMIMAFFRDINWVGFYLFDGDSLYLGPFQGLPACVSIPLGKGVCGTSAQTRQTLVVADTSLFPGHIACDSRSRSELVIPIVIGTTLYGVLDIDSPLLDRFNHDEKVTLEKAVHLLVDIL